MNIIYEEENQNKKKFAGRAYHNYIIIKTEYEALHMEIIAHEMVHRSYSIVYKNNAAPYSSSDSSAEKIYKEILDQATKTLKESFENEANEKIKQLYNYFYGENPYYHSDEFLRESIAHYVGKFVYANNPYKDIFLRYDEFIQNHTIPDFKNYIENHPKCRLAIEDKDINCRLIGEHDEL